MDAGGRPGGPGPAVYRDEIGFGKEGILQILLYVAGGYLDPDRSAPASGSQLTDELAEVFPLLDLRETGGTDDALTPLTWKCSWLTYCRAA